MDVTILCPDNDQLAYKVHHWLLKENVNARLITQHQLTHATSWRHEISELGKVNSIIILRDGRVIDSAKINVAFNRILSFPMLHFPDINNRHYAAMEQTALYTSFLKGLSTTLFEPFQTDYLSMHQNNIWRVYHCAVAAGLPVADLKYTTNPKNYPSVSQKVLSSDGRQFSPSGPLSFINNNQPVFSSNAFQDKVKITIVDSNVCDNHYGLSSHSIKHFSNLIKKRFYELHLAKINNKYVIYNVNLYPVNVSSKVVKVLCQSISTPKNN